MLFAPKRRDEGPRDETADRDRHGKHDNPTPWVSAEECQPRVRTIKALDEVDEALLESFPCSDPPSFSHAHI